jgi:hypothetical protein
VWVAKPEAAEEVEAEVDELEALTTAQLREKGNELGVVPVGDKRKAEVWRRGLRAARGVVQQAAVAAAARPKRVRKLAPSDGWQTAPAAVSGTAGGWRWRTGRRQEDAAADEAVVLEEDLSDEEADSAGPVKWTEGGGGQG